MKLHTHLRSLKPDDLFIEDLQDLLVNLEFCHMCYKSFGNCRNDECDDIFAYLLKLNPHFQSLRTLTRRLYEIRSLNIGIMEFNLILQALNQNRTKPQVKLEETYKKQQKIMEIMRKDIQHMQRMEDMKRKVEVENSMRAKAREQRFQNLSRTTFG